MTKAEAIQAMLEGKKITHRFFTQGEWIKMDKQHNIVTEEGYKTPEANFWTDRFSEAWDNDYELFNENEEIDLLENFIEDETLSHIECSKCHKRDNVSNYGQYVTTDFYKMGWRVVNNKCLCPNCSKAEGGEG